MTPPAVAPRIASMSLDARVALRLGALHLDAELAVGSGELVVLLGPNGAGKTTLLRALAGLVPLEAGRVLLDGAVLEAPAERIRVPTEHRPVGMVFQDYLLFPHLTALDNVAFGLRAHGLPRAEARRRASAWLERVGLAAHTAAKPKALSGGQAQRVALARALATDPRLLLLDEPLAALDAGARVELRRELRRHLAGYQGTRLLVTHDPIEAMTLADQIVVLEAGRVTQTGTPAEVSARPRSRYVADLVGLNLLRGRLDPADGRIELPGGAQLIAANGADQPSGGEVFAVIHPRAVALYRTHPDGTPRNVWPGTAEALDITGDRVRVLCTGPVPLVAEITPAAVAALHLADGGPIWASVKATEVLVYPA